MAMATTLPPRLGAVQQMVRRIKRKRVSWAAQDQLCQIRMFLAEDAPFLAGVAQEQLQVKSSTFMHATADLPPGFGGAFGRVGALTPPPPVNPALKVDVEALAASVVPAISWQCPKKIVLNQSWHVEAGEGSHEVEVQKQREAMTLEAIYPRSSAIPSSPFESSDQGLLLDDRRIPSIPVTAPDEDSDGEENPLHGVGPNESGVPVAGMNASLSSKNKMVNGSSSGGYFGPAVGTLTALSEKEMSSNSSNSSMGGIDTSLLLQLLANPSLVETLSGLQQNKSMVNTPHGNAANLSVTPNQSVTGCSFQSPAATSCLTRLTSSISSTTTITSTSASPNPASSSSISPPSSQATGRGGSWLQQEEEGRGQFQQFRQPVPAQEQMSLPPGFQQQYMQQQQQGRGGGRDDDKYYKELIMQHGGASAGGGSFGQHQQQGGGRLGGSVQQQQQQQRKGNGYASNAYPPGFGLSGETTMNSSGQGTATFKGRRVCAYYNTAKGCRNGLKCPFIHDVNKRGTDLMQQHHHQQPQHKRMRGFVHAAASAPATTVRESG